MAKVITIRIQDTDEYKYAQREMQLRGGKGN